MLADVWWHVGLTLGIVLAAILVGTVLAAIAGPPMVWLATRLMDWLYKP